MQKEDTHTDFYLAIISKGAEQTLCVRCGVTRLEVAARHKHLDRMGDVKEW